ncbi:MAG: glutamate ligase domain-containing protein, partial [Solirubrobacterales bacterium]
PVHLELLGTLEAIVEAKAEILVGLGGEGTAVVPADAEALQPHLSESVATISFGPGGDVHVLEVEVEMAAGTTAAVIATPAGEERFRLPFTEAHNLTNALAAIAIGLSLDLPLAELSRRTPEIVFSRLRGELIELAEDVVLINDCYNANPVSMRAALEHLRALRRPGRMVAVLGGMAELGPDAATYHREVAAVARELGAKPIVGVGELARDYSPDEWSPDARSAAAIVADLLEPGDAVLVKGSRAIGLEAVAEALAGPGGDPEPAPDAKRRAGADG